MDQEIKTPECDTGYSCMASEGEPRCSITGTVNNRVFFTSDCHQSCSYQHTFGNDYICTCPIRQAFYKKYHR